MATAALQPLADNLWIVDGPVPGLPTYRRQMVVARDAQRQLLIHSAIALDDVGMAQLEALGTLRRLVVPGAYHRLDAPAYKQRYPQLCVVAPLGAAARVQRVVDVDLTYEEFGANDCLQLLAAPGAAEGVVVVRSDDGVSLVFNDLLWTPSDGFVLRCLRQEAQVPWTFRAMHVRGARRRGALRAWLEQLALTPRLVRIIPAHGPAIVRDASAALQRVAAGLS